MNEDFYSKYFVLGIFNPESEKFKEEFLKCLFPQRSIIYKFVSFDENIERNNEKIESINKREIWVNNYNLFSDKEELDIICNIKEIKRKTGFSKDKIKRIIEFSKEICDVSCFTYEQNDFMWENYANNGKGLLLCFKVLNFEKLFPVIYLEKWEIDFTHDFINVLESKYQTDKLISIMKLAILPWVQKNVKFKKEKEIRLLCSDIYDDSENVLGGKIYAHKKDALCYRGTYYSYEYCGIELVDIVFGNDCDPKIIKSINEVSHG